MRVGEHKQFGSGQEMAEKYRINWDRHGTNISEAFRSLRKDEHLSDVTLACEEHQFQTHKVVLSAGSSFFERILETHKHPSPLIFLKGMEAKILDRLLDFMYHGNVELKQEELEIFLKSGEELGLRGLAASGSKPAGVPSEELSPSQNEMKLSSELAKDFQDLEAPPHSSVSSSSTTPLEEDQNMMCGDTGTSATVAHNFQIEEWKDLKKYVTVVKSVRGVGKDVYKSVVQYKCSLCERTMNHNEAMMRHIESEHFRNAFTHICPVCGKTFETKAILSWHKQKEHKVKFEGN